MAKEERNQKITLNVMLEDNRVYTNEYVLKQPLEVIVRQTIAHFHLNPTEERQLRREDGSELNDLHQKIEDVGIRGGETLRLIVKSPTKRRREGFA